jgi:hypothetical protein
MNITELENLAKAVYAPNKEDWELKQAILHFDRAANPKAILQLIALVKEMGEALEKLHDCFDPADWAGDESMLSVSSRGLAKYKEMTNGTA